MTKSDDESGKSLHVEPALKGENEKSSSDSSETFQPKPIKQEDENKDGSYMTTLILCKGVDPSNIENDTRIDTKVDKDTVLRDIMDRVVQYLHIPRSNELQFYTQSDNNQGLAFLALNETVSAVGVGPGRNASLFCQRASRLENARSAAPIEIVCTSRIGVVTQDDFMRKFKVIVDARETVDDMMNEVGDTLAAGNDTGLSGLKFRCGRTVLKRGRSYRDFGIKHGDIIVVTGGRG